MIDWLIDSEKIKTLKNPRKVDKQAITKSNVSMRENEAKGMLQMERFVIRALLLEVVTNDKNTSSLVVTHR